MELGSTKFKGYTWEGEHVHLIPDTEGGQIRSVLCGKPLPVGAVEPQGYDHKVCEKCRLGQDHIWRGGSLEEAVEWATEFDIQHE